MREKREFNSQKKVHQRRSKVLAVLWIFGLFVLKSHQQITDSLAESGLIQNLINFDKFKAKTAMKIPTEKKGDICINLEYSSKWVNSIGRTEYQATMLLNKKTGIRRPAAIAGN